MEVHDYFLIALAFLLITVITALTKIWLRVTVAVGYVTGQGGGAIILDVGWILLLLSFLFFLGFLLAGALKSYLLGPISSGTESP